MPDTPRDSAHDLLIQPRGGFLARDGRPFAPTPGARAASLPWPLPQTLAGALRTRIGNDLGFDWQTDGPDRARRIAVAGPLLAARRADEPWSIYLNAPRDALVVAQDEPSGATVYPLLPTSMPGGAGCDLPHPMLHPLAIRVAAKPARGYTYWPLDDIARWLVATPTAAPAPSGCLGPVPRESRVHVAIDRESDTAREGALFATELLAFADAPARSGDREQPARAMLCRVEGADPAWTPTSYLTVGGERGLSELRELDGDPAWPALPSALGRALQGAPGLRLLLATPALFQQGWLPGWLDDRLEGAPPATHALRLRLVAAAVGRREAVSGWDLRANRPKAARLMAPAGSIYFFRILAGSLDAPTLRALWLGSLCDQPQDRLDGFGLALPGFFDPGTIDQPHTAKVE